MKYDVCQIWGPSIEMGVQMSLLAGQTAVITGGAQGLGYAIAERFIAEGARVVLGDLNLMRPRRLSKRSVAPTSPAR